MGPVTFKFDENKQTGNETKEIRVVLKPRCETIVNLPTTSRELETFLISKTDISYFLFTKTVLKLIILSK
jgi:hypothetical protein